MKKRKLIAALLSMVIGMSLSISPTVLAHDHTVENSEGVSLSAIQPRTGCTECGQGIYVLQCRKSKYYSYDYTHTYDLTKTCTVIVYESAYRGYECNVCGNVESLGLDLSQRHACTERHGSCGDGLTDAGYCFDGSIF